MDFLRWYFGLEKDLGGFRWFAWIIGLLTFIFWALYIGAFFWLKPD